MKKTNKPTSNLEPFSEGIYQNIADKTLYKFFYEVILRPKSTTLKAQCLTGTKKGMPAFNITDSQTEQSQRFGTWRKLSQNEIKNLHLPQLQESHLVEEVL